MPIDPLCDVDHPDERAACGNKGDKAVNRDVLNGGGIVLYAVRGVGCALRVMIRKRETLSVAQELGPKIQDHPFTRKGPQ